MQNWQTTPRLARIADEGRPSVTWSARVDVVRCISSTLLGCLLVALIGESVEVSAGPPLVNTDVISEGSDLVVSDASEVNQLSQHDPYQIIPPAIARGGSDGYLNPYRARIDAQTDELLNANHGETSYSEEITIQQSPANPSMWWDELISRRLGFGQQALNVDVGSLTTSALAHSPRVKGLLAEPQIRQTEVTIADAKFDPTLFLSGKFNDTNDPVGSTLITGDQSRRFRDETVTTDAGIRQRTRVGGDLEIVQRGGFQQNNSIFLQPNPQGTTRLEINYAQPLWRDAGRTINRSQILVAQLRAHQASSETRRELESHLLEVTRAYWNLYRYRVLWLQQQRLVGSTRQLHAVLASRESYDAGRRQVVRARSALASRQAGLARAGARIKDAQTRLRMLVGSTELIAARDAEWITQERPLQAQVIVSPKQAIADALEFRPDITAALQTIHEVSVRVGVAKNQLLPQLDLLLSAYVAGLDGGRDPLGAFENQFSDGRPGFSIGLAYEFPVGNRAASSRLNRDRWELFQAIQEFRQTTESAIAEVEIAARETSTSYASLIEKRIAIEAARTEVDYLDQRYRELPGNEDSVVLLIDNLLDAQQRLAEQEREYVESQVAYANSWIELRRTTGQLLLFSSPTASGVERTAPMPGELMPGETTGIPFRSAPPNLQ